MNVIDTIHARRSVKHYDATHRMSEEEIRTLLSTAMQAPTAFNIQHWRFVAVTDPELRRQIRASAWDQAQVTDASLLIVLCADRDAWKKDPARYWRDAPEPVRDF
ncbi:MAG: nitroreductase family protein, partial [Verrucomicrobiae bacterium]|nr:nitroreductase family protein [Verrucomicrobiae bacterium]